MLASTFSRAIKGGNPRTTRVTIVHTITLLNLRGSEFWVMDVSNLLRDESLEVKIVNFDYAPMFPITSEEITIRTSVVNSTVGGGVSLVRLSALRLRLPLRRLWRGTFVEATSDRYFHFLPFSRRFLRLLRNSDVIYFVLSQGNPVYLIVVLGMSFLAGCKPVVAGVHVRPRVRPSELTLLRIAARFGILKAIHIVKKSQESELSRVGCRIEYIPNGVYYNKFYSDVENKRKQDRFVVLFVGAMTHVKGADLLPEIYQSLKSRGIQFVLVICTSGGELTHKIRDWSNGKPDVQFKGFVERAELSRLYAQASVAVFPSRREEFPLACLEAQASGTPVLVADLPGLRQVVVNRVNGVIAEGQNAESYGKGIDEIYSLWMSKRQDYVNMCRKAQENVRDNFQWSMVAKRIVNLLQTSLK
ncbi:MAG TPA: glycosyltransferase family 4 protein [Nitrososphaerales archaeon]|nr:glycosyltransferase family 4 protein [Nitrososphaerales archaeon]